MVNLEEWIRAILTQSLPDLEQRYAKTEAAAEELLPLRHFAASSASAASLQVSDALLEQFHEKLRGSSCEKEFWSALIWSLAKPLPAQIAYDLIDRKIAMTALEHSRQVDDVQWRLAEHQREALLTLAIDLYTQAGRSDEDFQELLRRFPDSLRMLQTLAYRDASSPEKEQAFLAVVSQHPEVQKIQRRHRLHKQTIRSKQATDAEEIQSLYATKDPLILRGLAENLYTPIPILEELAVMTGQVRHFSRENLRRRKQAEKRHQQKPVLAGIPKNIKAALTDLTQWDALTPFDREQFALALSKVLPNSFRPRGIETHQLNDQQHHIALFDWKGSIFALIPDGQITLGFHSEASPFPNDFQRENWRQTEAGFGVKLDEFLVETMTPPRTVTLQPFLIEVTPTELPENMAWQEITNRVSKHGFRLPTPDEWEYACGAGSQTLFRWGDTCPLTRLPTDEADWKLHQQPNAFGLRMPSNPYHWEVTSEPGVMRGGDGGSAICGGMGELAAWLPLATAFTIFWEDETDVIGAYLRRVFPLI